MNERITILRRSDQGAPRIEIKVVNLPERRQGPRGELHEGLRLHLLKRHDHFVINTTMSEVHRYTVDLNKLPSALIRAACAIHEPGVGGDYDYLRRTTREVACRIASLRDQVRLTFDVTYLTTAEQEAELDRVLRQLFYDERVYARPTPFERVKFAYDYIAKHVRYDKTFARMSAYNALMEGTAVCEGCSGLMYRMMSMLGVPCRIITGTGRKERHSWNLVKLDGLWYYLDVTWDLGRGIIPLDYYEHFLLGGSEFPFHTPDPDYTTPEFLAAHPMSPRKYNCRRRTG